MKFERFMELFGYGLIVLAIPLVFIGTFIVLWRVSEYLNYYPFGINLAIFVYVLVFGITFSVFIIGKLIERITERKKIVV